jgi:N-acetylmuramoyl-L-alanine amidase
MKKPQYIFIHHTAVSYDKNPNQWKATDAYHTSKGWGGGGYNYEVAKDGSVHQFREDGSVTAAQYQQNMNDGRALSICLDGNFDIELPTPEQRKTVADFIQEKMKKYDIPRENIFGHRKVAPKSCPGSKLPDDIYSYFMGELTDQVNEARSEVSDPPTNPILPWAEDAWKWGIQEGLITESSQVSVEMQRLMVVFYRYHLKISAQTGVK